jgi:hypothetical protein
MSRRRTPGPYLPLDINFTGNPKILALTDAAFRLHLSGLVYCKRHRTDGILSHTVLPTLVPRYRPAQLDELLTRMLWIELNGHGHYEIHDWLHWNLSNDEAQAKSDQARDAAHRGWDQRRRRGE